MASIFVPFAYLCVLVGALLTFSRIYRKRNASTARFDPWFPTHPERDTYITLLQQDPPAHETLLKAALLRRAVADVQRIMRVGEDKQALAMLVQKGSVGDDLLASFQQAEKELQAEIVEVMTEAATFREGWDKLIFQTANEMVQNERLKEIYTRIPKEGAEAGSATLDSKKAIENVTPKSEPNTPAESAAATPSATPAKKAKKRK